MLAAAAQVTSRIRLGTYVLNAAFYKPALLARDAADVDLLSDGRLDLGLGTGYVREEFEAAEMPYPSAGERIKHLEHVTEYLKANHPSIPVMIAGNGDRVLTVAAPSRGHHRAHRIRCGQGRRRSAGRTAGVRARGRRRPVRRPRTQPRHHRMPVRRFRQPDLSMIRRYAPDLTDEELLALPAASGRHATRRRRQTTRTARHLRHHLVQPAAPPCGVLLEGHRRTPLTVTGRPELHFDAVRPRSSGDRARLS